MDILTKLSISETKFKLLINGRITKDKKGGKINFIINLFLNDNTQ